MDIRSSNDCNNSGKQHVASCDFHVAACDFHVAACDFHVAACDFHVAACDFHVSACEATCMWFPCRSIYFHVHDSIWLHVISMRQHVISMYQHVRLHACDFHVVAFISMCMTPYDSMWFPCGHFGTSVDTSMHSHIEPHGNHMPINTWNHMRSHACQCIFMWSISLSLSCMSRSMSCSWW